MSDVENLERELHEMLCAYMHARQQAGLLDRAGEGIGHMSFLVHAFLENSDNTASLHDSVVVDPCLPTNLHGEFDIADAMIAPLPSIAATIMCGMTSDLARHAHDDAVRFKNASEDSVLGSEWYGTA